MELIHSNANATFSRNKKHSLENLASKQKTFRIVKEQQTSQRISAQKGVVTESKQFVDFRSYEAGSWWSQPGSNR